MSEILESRSNYIILKEYNLVKLYSYKSLVCIYDTETKTFEDVTYTFKDVYGTYSGYSKTTSRHINKFKKYIKDNF